jgi:hypothetical protein
MQGLFDMFWPPYCPVDYKMQEERDKKLILMDEPKDIITPEPAVIPITEPTQEISTSIIIPLKPESSPKRSERLAQKERLDYKELASGRPRK